MMSGWKTWCAALLALSYGVAGYALGLHGVDKLADSLITAMGLIGLGHKLDKVAGHGKG